MNRYFLELAYMGKGYAGFQIQENALTIQEEVEKALKIYYRESFDLTGSSRTDAGVHALQNYFHFDSALEMDPSSLYNLNAILPGSIVIKSIRKMKQEAHCRFDALSREYRYYVYASKNPFIAETAYYYPYKINVDALQQAAEEIKQHQDFESFSKRNTQVNNFQCSIKSSEWLLEKDCFVYRVVANRFLRGMVRGLVGTMLQVGRGKMNLEQFKGVIEARDASKADFAVPGQGLFLVSVNYPEEYFG
jgi:tRNA pseudouridine38-40 synthase